MGFRAVWVVTLSVALVSSPAFGAGSGWRAPALSDEAPEELRALLLKADELYAKRGGADGGRKALETLREAAAKHPQSWDVGWRLARAAFWVSESLPAASKAERRALATEGWKAGEAAFELAPDRAEAPYFMALCIGEYSHAVGLFTALKEGVEGKFRDPLLAVSKSAPKVDHGGVWNALGRYKFELPWPKRDLDQSIEWLRRAVETNPDNLRARVYLAESLEKRDAKGDVEEARKFLAEVANAPGNRYDPPEEARAKQLGRELAERLKWTIDGL